MPALRMTAATANMQMPPQSRARPDRLATPPEVAWMPVRPVNVRLSPLLLMLLVAPLAVGPLGVWAASGDYPDDAAVRFPTVFFPPVPPIYGARIEDHPAGSTRFAGGHRIPAPGGLADFAGDLIYPPLSTRLYAGVLSRSLETRIEQYRARRNGLVNALLDHCATLHAAPDDARERGFRALAAEQTPALAALEAEADGLRQELARGGLLSPFDWNARRNWKLDSFPPNRDWANREAEFQVVRAAAFYEDGWLPAQRGLLRELAMELAGPARRARGEPIDRLESDAMFFSPETTRLRLPPDLPPEVLRRISAYNRQKDALKQELRAALHAQDKAARDERTAAFARLAEEQWPHLGNLETLAEEVRSDLARRFVPVPPQKPPAIPTWLLEIIQAYNEDRDDYFGELRQALRQAMEEVPRSPRTADPDAQIRQDQEYEALRKQVQRQATLDFEKTHAARFTDLEKRYRAVRTALEAIAKTTRDPKTGRPLSVENLLQHHAASMAEFDGFGRATAIYENYRTAMLQRGLSPEQRRLLFSYALAALAQPLPSGEPLPQRSAKFPLPR